MPIELKVSGYSQEACDAYKALVVEIFSGMGPERIEKNIQRFSRKTRFYFIQDMDSRVSCSFFNPVDIAGVRFGGIGGVATKKEARGKGYASMIIGRIIEDSSAAYPMLLLWTRIPEFFERLDFKNAVEYFQDDPAGSVPMVYFRGADVKRILPVSGRLPRVYF